jgi:hypothetical protein
MEKHTQTGRARGDVRNPGGQFPLPGFVGSAEDTSPNKQTLRRVDAQSKVEDDAAAECRMENEGGPPSPAAPPRRATRE